jgi:hypothetical protein
MREVLRRLGAARWAAVGPQPSSHWLGCCWGVTARVCGRQRVDGEGLSCSCSAPANRLLCHQERCFHKCGTGVWKPSSGTTQLATAIDQDRCLKCVEFRSDPS